ncbi:glycerophosphodiester phosphodiesterase [Anaeromyxobacter diazotrophicus]|uniref:Glycerophosphoryl diester phosphodiesterase n=1 Tax=Anaeromyxobacter diazotrophicus TaxID=2590199 RepID=A0A7I9VI55_9BACT|nr:glycerophosphodiester phosphodiesterase family protein [Anaeromyxobacter diazotrophicus]GEJ56096.1 glycerophosphoryl diester phosphodiesterase [Anaeromyxobacter diazotrophicus]
MAGDSATTAERRPIILAHRGASADAPENTLAAFRLALDQGADGVELDVWRCATGEVVVHHDADTRRTAGAALRLRRAPLRELRALDVGAWRGGAFRGERIPLLAEVLEALPGAIVNVELKAERLPDLALAAAVARVLHRAGAAGRCVVSSFDALLLAAFRAAAPAVPRGLLVAEGRTWRLRAGAGARLARPDALHPQASLVTAARAAAWRARGLAVRAWTVDEEAEVARLARLGVTALITNRPAAALAAARRAAGATSR